MTSHRVGVVRDSMLTNPLFIKAPLGQSRSRGLAAPGPDFTFETSSHSVRGGGVADALSSWNVMLQSTRTLPPDFVSLNRDAVKSGLVTSKELSQYRAQVGVARRQRPTCPTVPPHITSGPPSYQCPQCCINQQSRNQTSNHKQVQVRPRCVVDNRTSLLRRSRRPLPVAHTPFTLPQFSQVAPALDTFRSPEARQRACVRGSAD